MIYECFKRPFVPDALVSGDDAEAAAADVDADAADADAKGIMWSWLLF